MLHPPIFLLTLLLLLSPLPTLAPTPHSPLLPPYKLATTATLILLLAPHTNAVRLDTKHALGGEKPILSDATSTRSSNAGGGEGQGTTAGGSQAGSESQVPGSGTGAPTPKGSFPGLP